MSDVSQGPGWWLPGDGTWYPPQLEPGIAPPPPPAQPIAVQLQKPRKKQARRPLCWTLLAIAVFFGGCSGTGAGVGTSVDHRTHETQTVVYSVTGSGTPTTPLITYATLQKGSGQQGLAQVSNTALPWSKTITVSGQITAFSVSVQNGPVGLSYVVCKITEDGKVLSTNTAKGPFAFASCSAVGVPS
jgi:hypothetical protein